MSKQKTMSTIENSSDSVIDINIKSLIPNVIDGILVTIKDGHHTLFLPINTIGLQFKNWKKGKGGIYSKDVLNYSLNKPYGKYVIIKKDNESFVARIIEKNDIDLFKSLKLISGYIKSKPYMILKSLSDDEKLSDTHRYINEKDVYINHQEETIITSEKIQHDEEFDDRHGSISLFND